jgi:hypothetical protein
MVLRRLAVALVAVVVPMAIAVAPAEAATYPPKPPTQQTTVASGVVYGGTMAGAKTLSVGASKLSGSVRLEQGEAYVLNVAGYLPGSDVAVSVLPPNAKKVLIGALTADGNGTVVAGPFRLTAPGRYLVSLEGTDDGNVTGLGVGGVRSAGMSRVFADPTRVVEVSLTVAAAGDSALPRTGGDGGGHSALGLGIGIVLAGALLMLVAGVRRRAAHARV